MNSAVREFLSQLNRDHSMQRELESLRRGRPGLLSADELMAFAAARGYSIRIEEMDEEMDEQSLDAVSGGIALLLPAVQQAREAARSPLQTLDLASHYSR